MKSIKILILLLTAGYAGHGNASAVTNRDEKENETLTQARIDQLNDLLRTARSKEKNYQDRVDSLFNELVKITKPYHKLWDTTDELIAELTPQKDKAELVKKLQNKKESLRKELSAKKKPLHEKLDQYRKLLEKAKAERIQLEQKLKGLPQQAISQAEKPKIIIEHAAKNPPLIPDHIMNLINVNTYSPEIFIQWLDENPQNKNAVNASGTPLLHFALLPTTSPQVLDELLKKNVDTYGVCPMFQAALEAEEIALDIAIRFLPETVRKLIPLTIKQSSLHELNVLLKRAYERKESFYERRKLFNERLIDNNQMIIDGIEFELKRRAAQKKLREEEATQRRETERVIAQERLITPDAMTTTFKELFAEPQGKQKIVHAMKKAIRTNDLKLLADLIGKKNENIELKDERGYTPLLQAVYTNKPEAVKLLLNAGAQPEATIKAADDSLVNALELAKLLDYKEIEALLETASKKEKAKE